MKITWVGHSCFTIEHDGYTVITDPYEDGSVPGLSPVRESAHEVLVSHEHGDHNARRLVEILPAPAAGSPFTVTRIETFHDPEKGALRGPNTIHILRAGGFSIAHLGDLGCRLEPDQLEQLRGMDVVLVPVGGFFTIDGAEAAALIQEINPAHVVPMHFRDPEAGFGFDVIGPVESFTGKMGPAAAVRTNFPVLDLDAPPQAQIIVLHPQNSR